MIEIVTGLGWIPNLLASERPAWSSEDPKTLCPPKDAFPLPAGGQHVWVDEDWVLDTNWASVDDDGWVYTDYNWRHAKPEPFHTAFTRRRKWVRRYGLVRDDIGGVEVGKAIKSE